MSSNAQAATNPAVYAVGKMHISGNVIPNTWYQTIQTPGGKPYLNAIILLADIVYWYRPTEVRDDLLQRSYAALSDQFSLSRKQIKDALVFLENLGVITRVFRNKIVGGQCLSNVMYLDLHAAKLYELTYPTSVAEETCREDSEVCTAGDTGADFCDAVRRGDEAMLSEALLQPQNTLLYITGDPLQDARYQTVCELQGAADAAVQGGLSAFEASELTHVWCQSAVHIGRESELERFRRECLVQLCRKTAKAAGQRRFSVHVRSAIDYIEGHSDSVLTTEEIASAVGLSASRLSAVFRKESGESVHQFVIRKKLERAALLLRETTVSIPEIAGLLHFSDQSHLTRLFHRQYGVTPYRYRLKEDSTEMD